MPGARWQGSRRYIRAMGANAIVNMTLLKIMEENKKPTMDIVGVWG